MYNTTAQRLDSTKLPLFFWFSFNYIQKPLLGDCTFYYFLAPSFPCIVLASQVLGFGVFGFLGFFLEFNRLSFTPLFFFRFSSSYIHMPLLQDLYFYHFLTPSFLFFMVLASQPASQVFVFFFFCNLNTFPFHPPSNAGHLGAGTQSNSLLLS